MKKQIIGKFAGLLAATAIWIGTSPSALATLVINLPSNVNPPVNGFIAGSSNPTAAEIAAALGITTAQLGPLLYKINNDGSEDGTLQNSYNSPSAPWSASTPEPITIVYNGGQFAAATYLLVKDGNLGSYIFNIGSSGLNWNGVEDIAVYNLFDPAKPDLSGTSHIEFFGAAVPEPSTYVAGALLLIPLLAQFRRWRRAA